MQLTHTLTIRDKSVHCTDCGYTFSRVTTNWKTAANLDEEILKQLGGPYTTGDEVRLRKFSCPGCGLLLDCEMALPEDPFLEDVIYDGA